MWRSSLVPLLIACSAAANVHNDSAAVDLVSAGPPTRIIGGAPTTIDKYPFLVQVTYNNQAHCAGSLLTSRHVLSAAHCYVDINGNVANPRFFKVRVGTTYLNTGGVVHDVAAITVHSGYDEPPRDNDIAVLLLATNASAGTAALPQQGAVVPDGSMVTLVGWGRTNASIPVGSEVLMSVEVPVVPRAQCVQRYLWLQAAVREPFPVTDNMICAGLLDVGGKDACQGDSGGPVLFQGEVVGVTSWGYGCAEPYFPGVSARVSNYANWISRVVNGSPSVRSANVGVTATIITLLGFLNVVISRGVVRTYTTQLHRVSQNHSTP